MKSIIEQPALLTALIIAATAVVTDLKSRTIPNALVVAGSVAGLCLNGWIGGGAGLLRSLLGGLGGFIVFLPFYLLRGMGGGDIKLMAALGFCLGLIAILQTALVASIAGAVLAIVVAARQGALSRTLSNTGRLLVSWITRGPRPSKELSLDNPKALKIPYALPIAVGSFFIVISGTVKG